ncbi:hypothetical protein PA08_0533 [Cutibacterium modestum P08]|nr:hypothetical protein PA08_0533 [Cutibacterium modestum P08]
MFIGTGARRNLGLSLVPRVGLLALAHPCPELASAHTPAGRGSNPTRPGMLHRRGIRAGL